LKRYNSINKKFFLCGLVIPILLFFVSYSLVYAYFTSRIEGPSGNTSAALVKIGFVPDSNQNKVSHEIKTNTVTSSEIKIMPGDTLVANATIKNEGTVKIYSILHYFVQAEKTNGEIVTIEDCFYNILNDGSTSKLVKNNGNYTDPAFMFEVAETVDVSIYTHFKSFEFGNDFKNAKVTYSITAYAIQTVGIGSAITATNLMANSNSDSNNVHLLGNSIQNEVPTLENPAEIQSVGNKTANIFNIKENPEVEANCSYSVNNNIITVDPTDNSLTRLVYKINVKTNTTYTVSGNFEMINPTDYNGTCTTVIREGASSGTAIKWGSTLKNETGEQSFSYSFDSGNYSTLYFWLYYNSKNDGTQLNGNSYGIYKNLQIEEGSTATTYEPYGYKIPISVTSKNLISKPYTSSTSTKNGLTFTILEDDGIQIQGTSTADTLFQINNNLVLKPGTYTIGGGKDNVIVNARKGTSTSSSSWIESSAGNTYSSLETEEFSVAYIGLYILADKTIDTIIYPTFTREISEVIYLDQPLRKIGDNVDYIDFASAKVVRNIKSITLDGTENWQYSNLNSQYERFILKLGLKQNQAYCNVGIPNPNAWNEFEFDIQADSEGNLRFYRPFYAYTITDLYPTASVANWKAYLAQRYAEGNPIIVDYAVSSVIVEDVELPDVLDCDIAKITIDTEIKATYTIWN